MIRRPALVLAACALAAGCSSDADLTAATRDATPPPATSPAPAVSPTPSPDSSGPPFTADTARDEQQASGGPLGVTEIRVARQDGYDRVVFELDGREPGQPGWTVEYVDDAREDGSGDAVEVEGDAVLEVRISGVGYPSDTGVEGKPDVPAVPPGVERVEDVAVGALFEGVLQAFVGVDRKAPFRVFRLEDPARVVIDVRHD